MSNLSARQKYPHSQVIEEFIGSDASESLPISVIVTFELMRAGTACSWPPHLHGWNSTVGTLCCENKNRWQCVNSERTFERDNPR